VYFLKIYIYVCFYIQVVFRKIADLKRERELAETRKNEGLDQIGSDHPVRKLISKFRKISQESRAASQNNPNTSVPSTTNSSQPPPPPTLSLVPQTTVQPASAEPIDSPPVINTVSSLQLLQLPPPSITKQRDKLETISERIESQESQISQITSLNQSPPLQRHPRSSKWKWLKTGSTEPETDSSSIPLVSNVKPQQQSTNPFDPNLSDDDIQSKAADGNGRKPAVPLSLFIPRSARRETLKTPEEGIDDQVKSF
jgi:hypothetical protein